MGRRGKDKELNGIFLIDKPKGITSFDVVRRVKRLTGVKKVGHIGTLDPIATGVLPICLGQATKLIPFLMDGEKVYEARFILGLETDTQDLTGEITNKYEGPLPERETVEAALEGFKGEISQDPPYYSALKHQGKPLYQWMREGVPIKKPPRKVTIYELTLMDYAPPGLNLKVVSSRGAYLRTLGADLGKALGCGAAMEELRRIKNGPFPLSEALLLPELEAGRESGDWIRYLYPMNQALLGWPEMEAGQEQREDLTHGRGIRIKNPGGLDSHLKLRQRVKIISPEGELLALGRMDRLDRVTPFRVFI